MVPQAPRVPGPELPEGEAAIDVDNVRLLSPAGENLVRNGRFEDGFDHWLFAVDWDPAWHIHNLWFAIYFEQGWLGMVAFALLALYGLATAVRATLRGDRLSPALLGSVVALLAVGLSGSSFDFP